MLSHRQLARKMDLYSFPDWAPGMPYLHARGLALVAQLESWARERLAAGGYEEVRSPQLCKAELWQRSGHWGSYMDKMFSFEIDGDAYALKAMNCPAHAMLVADRAWRGPLVLPIRIAEMGHLHRAEPSGSVNGLLRARSFCQDDAHLFCAPDQVHDEVMACLSEMAHVYEVLGVPVAAELSLRPDKRFGEDALWDQAEQGLRDALAAAGISFEERAGEGAFYGPKIDLHAADARGRAWQMGSLQLDYVQPDRLGVCGAAEQDIVMIHRAHYGSYERLVGLLLEHYEGRLPLWLAPDQVRVLPIGEDQAPAAHALAADLAADGHRVDVDERGSLAKRVHRAHEQYVAVVAVLGEREVASNSVALRVAGQQAVISQQQLRERLSAQVAARAADGAQALLG